MKQIRKIALAAATALLLTAALAACTPAETPEDTEPEPQRVLRVACVGDSITEGMTITNPADFYPAQLQSLLGDRYDVGNFGVSGRTLQSSIQTQFAVPYTNEQAYIDSLEMQPDIVLIMLGTNDAFWSWDAAAYEAELAEFAGVYMDLPSAPTVYLMTCAPSFMAGFDSAAATIADEVNPIIRAVAADLGLQVIDIYAALDGQPGMFADGLHPNAAGAAIIAQTVYDAVS